MSSRAPDSRRLTLPVDQGFGHVGLLMQLGAGCMIFLQLILLASVIGRDHIAWWPIELVLALGIVRSGFHYAAGRHLARRAAGALRLLRVYLILAALHTAAFPALASVVVYWMGGWRVVALLTALLLLWPALVFLFYRARRAAIDEHWSRAAADPGDPWILAPRDLGVAGLGALSLVFATAGAIAALTLPALRLQSGLRLGWVGGIALWLWIALLWLRPLFHLGAAHVALGGPTPLGLDRRTRHYLISAVFSVVGLLAVGCTYLIITRTGRTWVDLLHTVFFGGLFLVWPMVISGFTDHLNPTPPPGLPKHIAPPPEPPAPGPAPDRGFTALGYLLLAFVPFSLLAVALIKTTGLALAPPKVGWAWADYALLGAAPFAAWAGWQTIRLGPRLALALRLYAFGAIACALPGLMRLILTIGAGQAAWKPWLQGRPYPLLLSLFIAAVGIGFPLGVLFAVSLSRRSAGTARTS